MSNAQQPMVLPPAMSRIEQPIDEREVLSLPTLTFWLSLATHVFDPRAAEKIYTKTHIIYAMKSHIEYL